MPRTRPFAAVCRWLPVHRRLPVRSLLRLLTRNGWGGNKASAQCVASGLTANLRVWAERWPTTRGEAMNPCVIQSLVEAYDRDLLRQVAAAQRSGCRAGSAVVRPCRPGAEAGAAWS